MPTSTAQTTSPSFRRRRRRTESWFAHGDPRRMADEFKGVGSPRSQHCLSRVETCFWWGLFTIASRAKLDEGALGLPGRRGGHPMLRHLGQGAQLKGLRGWPSRWPCFPGAGPRIGAGRLSHHARLRRGFVASGRRSVQRESRARNGRRYDSEYKDIRQRDEENRPIRRISANGFTTTMSKRKRLRPLCSGP